jgi:hypothetical protein
LLRNSALQEQALEQRKLRPNLEEIPIPTDMLSASMSPMRVTNVSTTASSRFEDLFRYPLDLIYEGGLAEVNLVNNIENYNQGSGIFPIPKKTRVF